MVEKKTPTEAASAASSEMVPLSLLDELIEQRLAERLSRLDYSAQNNSVERLGEAIALNTAEIAAQGTGKKAPIDPKTRLARKAAWEDMLVAIADAHEKQERAEYKIAPRQTVFLPSRGGASLIEFSWFDHAERRYKDTIIAWAGVPNQVMIPQNKTAKKIHALFMRAIAYDPKETPKHAVMGFDVSYISGGKVQEILEVAMPTIDPVGGVEIISGQTKTTQSVAVMGGIPPVEQTY